MKKIAITMGLALLALASACASSAVSTEAASPGTVSQPESASTPPDADKARAHLQKHVQYPADRQTILAACADTPEFSAGEKRWFEEHLPEGTYLTAEQTISALHL